MTTPLTKPTAATPGARPGSAMRVALFITCINDVMYPGTGRATVELLERLGCTVEFPTAQTCCAQITTNTGYLDESVPQVRQYLKAVEGYDHVVSPSGSCTAAVREQHPMLARHSGDMGLVAAVDVLSQRVFDIPEFLVDVLGVTDVGAYFPHTVTYHPSCHGKRLLRLGDKPLQLLQAVRGMTLVDLPEADQCCGFGGTFSIKNADVSAAMASDKARHVRETGAEFVVGGDNSCLMNIGGVLSRQNSGVRPIHLVEILNSTEEVLA